jgi:hypothetical protein
MMRHICIGSIRRYADKLEPISESCALDLRIIADACEAAIAEADKLRRERRPYYPRYTDMALEVAKIEAEAG